MPSKWNKIINNFGGALLIVALVYLYAATRILTQAFFIDDASLSAVEVSNSSYGNHHYASDIQSTILSSQVRTNLFYHFWIALILATSLSLILFYPSIFFSRGPPLLLKNYFIH